MSDEIKEKISLSKLEKNFKHTQESKLLISEARKGIIFSEDHKKKLSEINKGKKFWNNGIINRLSHESPGEDFCLGFLKK